MNRNTIAANTAPPPAPEPLVKALLDFVGRAAQSTDPALSSAAKQLKSELRRIGGQGQKSATIDR